MNHKISLTEPFQLFFNELVKDKYKTSTVYDYFVKQQNTERDEEKITVIIRIDVDNGFHLTKDIANHLAERNINATFYYFTFPSIYYDIWSSNIPKFLADKGFEIGIHSDHAYAEKINGIDGLSKLKSDVKRLEKLIEKPVQGITSHGNPKLSEYDSSNTDIYRFVPPKELGVSYHMGEIAPYLNPRFRNKTEKVNYLISDYLVQPGGVLYHPTRMVLQLKEANLGETVHVICHPCNILKWWEKPWDSAMEPPWERLKCSPSNLLRIKIIQIWDELYWFLDNMVNLRSKRNELYRKLAKTAKSYMNKMI